MLVTILALLVLIYLGLCVTLAQEQRGMCAAEVNRLLPVPAHAAFLVVYWGSVLLTASYLPLFLWDITEGHRLLCWTIACGLVVLYVVGEATARIVRRL